METYGFAWMLIIVGAGTGILFVLATVYMLLRQHSFTRARRAHSKEEFVEYFVSRGFSESLVISVYSNVTYGRYFDFPLLPQDELSKIHGIVGGDLDDLIRDIAEANDLRLPVSTDAWKRPPKTIEDLIRFVSSFPIK